MPGALWTNADDERLRRFAAEGATPAFAAAGLGRSVPAVRHRAKSLGVKLATDEPPVWTVDEDRQLGEMIAARVPLKVISQRLGRTLPACSLRSYKKGFRVPHKQPWSSEDDDRLRALVAEGRDYGFAAIALGRTRQSVRQRAHRLGLCRRKPRSSCERWTADEDAAIVGAGGAGPTELAVMRLSGRTADAVSSRARALGLRGNRCSRRLWSQTVFDDTVLERVRAHHGAGRTNEEISRLMLPVPVTPRQVQRLVRRLGLFSNPEPPAQQLARKRAVMDRIRHLRWNEKKRHGWALSLPSTLSPREVRAVVLLVAQGGPMTLKEIRKAAGVWKLKMNALSRLGLVTVEREGLVLRYAVVPEVAARITERTAPLAAPAGPKVDPQELRDLEAKRLGLPVGLQDYELRVVKALVGGAGTREQLAAAVGRAPTSIRMGRLERLGVVTCHWCGALPATWSLRPEVLERIGGAA